MNYDNPLLRKLNFIRRMLESFLLLFIMLVLFGFIGIMLAVTQEKDDDMMHQFVTNAGYFVQQSFVHNPIVLDQSKIWELEDRYNFEKTQLDELYEEAVEKKVPEDKLALLQDEIDLRKQTFDADIIEAEKQRDLKRKEDTKNRFEELLYRAGNLMEKGGSIFFVFDKNNKFVYTPKGASEDFIKAINDTLLNSVPITNWQSGDILMTQLDSQLFIGAFTPLSIFINDLLSYIEIGEPLILTVLVIGCIAICWIQVYISNVLVSAPGIRSAMRRKVRSEMKATSDKKENDDLDDYELDGDDGYELSDEDSQHIWDNIADSLGDSAASQMRNVRDVVSQEITLPQLANKGVFENALHGILQQVRTSNMLARVICVNIDRMRVYNEEKGHASGNILLQDVSNTLHKAIGKNGFYSRFPGDEFMVLLISQSNESQAKVIHDMLTATNILLRKSYQVSVPISTSLAYTLLTPEDENILEVYKRANVAMAGAKKRGGASAVDFDADSADALFGGVIQLPFQSDESK